MPITEPTGQFHLLVYLTGLGRTATMNIWGIEICESGHDSVNSLVLEAGSILNVKLSGMKQWRRVLRKTVCDLESKGAF